MNAVRITSLFVANPSTGLDQLADAVSATREGNRNHMLFWATLRAAEEGYEPESIEEVLTEAAQQAGLGRREAIITIHSGFRRANAQSLWGSRENERGSGHTCGPRLDWSVPGNIELGVQRWLACPVCQREVTDAAGSDDADEPTPLVAAVRSLGFRPLSDLIETWDPSGDTFTVDRLLRPGYRCLIAAYEATGKTYLAIQLALHLAYPDWAGPVFGEFAVNTPQTVLYVDQEIGDGEFIRRAKTLASELGISLDETDYLRVVTLDTSEASLREEKTLVALSADIDHAHAETGRQVTVILDSADSLWGKVLWGDQVQGFDEAISFLRHGRGAWLHLIVLCHTVKRPRDGHNYKVDLQSVLGNVTRQADSVIVLDGERGETTMQMDVYKRPGRSSGILQREPEHTRWTWTTDLVKPKAVEWRLPPEAIMTLMSSRKWNAYALSKALPGGISRNTVAKYLDALVEEAQVDCETVTEHGKEITYYWVIEPVKADVA